MAALPPPPPSPAAACPPPSPGPAAALSPPPPSLTPSVLDSMAVDGGEPQHGTNGGGGPKMHTDAGGGKRKNGSSTLIKSSRKSASPGLRSPMQLDTELDQYLKEHLTPRKEEVDILQWWKAKSETYPVLSRIARDVLAIPASTVPSESAFSTGGRVVSDYRSSLAPTTIEALICLQDWFKAAYARRNDGISS